MLPVQGMSIRNIRLASREWKQHWSKALAMITGRDSKDAAIVAGEKKKLPIDKMEIR